MATFALVHGVCAGAWCWRALAPHLEAAGHDVVAVDLPCEDPAAGFADYAEVVCQALEGGDDDVVVVGHSTGGATIPLVAARRPVRELVYVCAIVPVPGRAAVEDVADYRAVDPGEWQLDNGDGSFSVRPEAVGRHIAPEVDPAVIEETAALLRRQYVTPFLEPCPLEAMPEVPSRYVLCRDDHLVDPAWSRRIVPERLGVEPIELPGGHMPMASRPGELAEILLGV